MQTLRAAADSPSPALPQQARTRSSTASNTHHIMPYYILSTRIACCSLYVSTHNMGPSCCSNNSSSSVDLLPPPQMHKRLPVPNLLFRLTNVLLTMCLILTPFCPPAAPPSALCPPPLCPLSPPPPPIADASSAPTNDYLPRDNTTNLQSHGHPHKPTTTKQGGQGEWFHVCLAPGDVQVWSSSACCAHTRHAVSLTLIHTRCTGACITLVSNAFETACNNLEARSCHIVANAHMCLPRLPRIQCGTLHELTLLHKTLPPCL
jgi:hypothetical protein